MEAGSQLGPYTLLRRVGTGGHGEVWKAEHDGLESPHRQVALKVASGAGALQHEHRLGELLGHPHMVEVHDLGQVDGHCYLALEWVDGPSLEQRLLTDGPLPPRAVVELGHGLAAALAHTHEHGVVHRDVSPANVLLTSDGVPKLSDLGLAVFVDDQTDSQRAGTPGYLSPEQSRGLPLDGRSDLWSLGAVLFRAATGRHLLGRRVPVDPDKLAGAREAVPDALAACPMLAELVMALTSSDPTSRPDAAATAAWLARLRDGELPGSKLLQCLEGAGPAVVAHRVGNVVLPDDPFFGRHAEQDDLRGLLDSGGIVTVHGPGGMGKTRLTLEVASRLHHPGGVWVVDLSGAHRVEGVCAAVAATLSVPLEKTDPVVVLGQALAGRPPLVLVLDNAERAIEAVTEVVAAWSRRARVASLVVTSREVMGVPGEQVLPLDALDPDAQLGLFRARALARGWDGGEPGIARPESRELAGLLARVDGLPLAIELAAAQVAEVGVAAAVSALSSPDTETPGLHPSMSAALRGSWALLDSNERAALAQLTVFEQGLTADAADAVLELPTPDLWSLDVLEALHDKALVYSRDAGRSGPRFGLYEPVRQFAAGHLVGRAKLGTHRRHAAHFTELADPPRLQRARWGDIDALRELVVERANLTAALAQAADHHWPDHAAALAEALWAGYEATGPFADGLGALELALAVPGLSARVRTDLLCMAGNACEASGVSERAHAFLDEALRRCEASALPKTHTEVLTALARLHTAQGGGDVALKCYGEAVRLHRDRGDRAGEADVLRALGGLQRIRGDHETARSTVERALAAHREVGNLRGEGMDLAVLAGVDLETSQHAEAVASYERALDIHRATGFRRGEAVVLGGLAVTLHRQGRIELARSCYGQALTVCREIGHHSLGAVLGNLGCMLSEQGEYAEARALLEEALDLHRETKQRGALGATLANLGELYANLGLQAQSQDALNEALVIARLIDFRTLEGGVLLMLARAALERGEPGPATDTLDEGEELLRSIGHLGQLSLALCLRVELCLHREDLQGAAQALELARTSVTDSTAGPLSHQGRELRRVEALVAAASTG